MIPVFAMAQDDSDVSPNIIKVNPIGFAFGVFNLNYTVGHDCIINNFVNIAPGANISGNLLIEQRAYIGTNAAILKGRSFENKIRIGKFSVVRAGSVVTKDVKNNATVVGIPARSL